MHYTKKIQKNNFTLQEYKLYSRHLILSQIQIQGQKRLKNAKVLCIGAGALGAINLLYLVSCGIGQIGIVDNDIVELSNLQRQIIYNTSHLGYKKVLSAQEILANLNPHCKINTYDIKLSFNNAFNIIKLYDIIIDGTDNFEIKNNISYFCHALHKIHIYGAVYEFEGHVSIFNYQSGPNYPDLYPIVNSHTCKPCTHGGIIGVIPGLIGIIQATETIKIILGLGDIINNYVLIYNSLDMSFKKIFFNIHSQKQKVSCSTINNIFFKQQRQYIHIGKLYRIIKNNSLKIYLIDIRNKYEYNIYHIKGAINIPLYKLTLDKQINTLKIRSIHKKIIIYCSNYQRSIIASKILHNAQIDNWILYKYIDPAT
jgi:sulfur-carrier protein adenylyltransferase/sulfurtransferase|uniref:Molybdopterin biosynthesis protein n=1 Tax=Thorea hispida TaxID=202687 RepID=A0A1C9CAM5_9FLOR|nr:molybdopterin biosynthesis protein [Thorea hispida]AOM65442.1 molybdopterin biosynthesis protein [Thorea hispida]ARX95811.1 molybdopterin biosynthesis protein [Thorea hispida]